MHGVTSNTTIASEDGRSTFVGHGQDINVSLENETNVNESESEDGDADWIVTRCVGEAEEKCGRTYTLRHGTRDKLD